VAKYHVLDSGAAVAHFAMPSGNNDAGTPWKTCYLASFGANSPTTRLMVGNGTGQIQQQEANQIGSGDLIELLFNFSDDPTLTLQQRQALLSTLGQRAIDEYTAQFASRFRLYGYTQNN